MCFVKSSESGRAEVAQGTVGLGTGFKKLTEHPCDGTAWTGNQGGCAAQPEADRAVMAGTTTLSFILRLRVLTVTTWAYMEHVLIFVSFS